jgi:hypothetical protein
MSANADRTASFPHIEAPAASGPAAALKTQFSVMHAMRTSASWSLKARMNVSSRANFSVFVMTASFREFPVVFFMLCRFAGTGQRLPDPVASWEAALSAI